MSRRRIFAAVVTVTFVLSILIGLALLLMQMTWRELLLLAGIIGVSWLVSWGLIELFWPTEAER